MEHKGVDQWVPQHLTLKGHCLRLRGDCTEAAQLFLQASEHHPDPEAAAELKILSHIMVQDLTAAHALASAARASHPSSVHIASSWVQTAPHEATVESLESVLPRQLMADPDLFIGLAQASYQRGRFDLARHYAKLTTDKLPSSIDAKILWALSSIAFAFEAVAALSEAERVKLEEAADSLRSSISSLRGACDAITAPTFF